MNVLRIDEVTPERFPSGRETRRLAGVAGLPATHFALGHSVLEPGGAIPNHEHPNEEVYVILGGRGLMTVGEEWQEVGEGDCVFIPPDTPHDLRNTGTDEMTVLWVFAPADVLDHWAEERAGRLVAPLFQP
jgi:mannose-6-phosphate isomerase-like protein (cupin superfamily)